MKAWNSNSRRGPEKYHLQQLHITDDHIIYSMLHILHGAIKWSHIPLIIITVVVRWPCQGLFRYWTYIKTHLQFIIFHKNYCTFMGCCCCYPVLYCSTTSDLINYIPSHVCGGWHRTRTEPEIVLRPHLWTNKFMRAQHASCPEHMTIASLVTLTGQLPAADDNKQLHQRTNYNYEKNPIGLSAGNY